MGNQIYDSQKIGARIRTERKNANYRSAESFGSVLNIGRSQVEQIERGERLPDLDTLVKMAAIFQCEIGYLLCEYDCKTRQAADIKAETGLSEPAIAQLKSWQSNSLNPYHKTNAVFDQRKIALIEAFIKYPEMYLIANLYSKLQEEKAQYNDREAKYREFKEACVNADVSKEQFFESLYEPVRNRTFQILMEFQRFLDK